MIHEPVPLGPRAYRSKLRGSGPLVALVPPGLLGVVSLLLLRGHTSLVRGVAGFLTAVLAAPGPARGRGAAAIGPKRVSRSRSRAARCCG